jgi:uncharacterized protein YuzE
MSSHFGLDVSFSDATGEPVAAYLRIRDGQVATTEEVAEGAAFADYAADGLLLGVELLAPCSLEVMDRLGANESEPVRRFLRGGAPRELIVA